jgi:hypothetical protein
MGTLYLEVSKDEGSTWDSPVTWSLTGDQGNAWVTGELVDLSAYSFQTVRIRFRGVTGTNFRSDMAIDNVCLSFKPVATNLAATYNGNGNDGGAVPIDVNNPYSASDTVTVLGNTGNLSLTGYAFSDWNTAGNGSGNPYAANDTFTISAHTDLYAQWTANDYTVTFDKQSGMGGSNSVLATYDSPMPAASAPTRNGFTFGGYYSGTNGTGIGYYSDTMVSLGTWDVANTATLYAQWTLKPAITITADSNNKTYDGTPLTGSGYSLTTGALESGHSLISVTVTGSQTNAGIHSSNIPSNALIEDSGSNDITSLYEITYANGVLDIAKATPTAALQIGNSPVTYDGNPQSATVSIATSSVPGAIANVTNGMYTDVGSYAVTADFTPTDTANYETLTSLAAGDFVIYQATPSVSVWPTATGITYGQSLSDSSLSGGTASVAGSFSFDNPATTPDAGNYPAAVTFTPTDTANYQSVAGHTGSVSLEVLSVYQDWSDDSFANPFTETNPNDNPDNDNLNNTLEFAFGTDPTASDGGSLAYVNGGAVTDPGAPIIEDFGTPGSPDYHAVFSRRKDHALAGLTYTVRSSADLVNWVDSSTIPTIQSDPGATGDVDAVSIPFPALIEVNSNFVQPTFFLIKITTN